MQKDRVTSKRCPLTSSLRHTVGHSDGCKLSNSYRNPRSSCCRGEDLDHSTVEPRMYSTLSRDICMQKGSSTRGGVTAQRSGLGRVTSFCGNSMNPFQGQGHCQQLPYFPYQAPPLKRPVTFQIATPKNTALACVLGDALTPHPNSSNLTERLNLCIPLSKKAWM